MVKLIKIKIFVNDTLLIMSNLSAGKIESTSFVIPPNGKFKLNACDCGICK
jgi:hypothetical protein